MVLIVLRKLPAACNPFGLDQLLVQRGVPVAQQHPQGPDALCATPSNCKLGWIGEALKPGLTASSHAA
jgi:hypothetical protein